MPFWKNLLSGSSSSSSSKDSSPASPSSSSKRGSSSSGTALAGGSTSSSSSLSSSSNAKRPGSSSGALGAGSAANSSSHSSLIGRQSGAQTPTAASAAAGYNSTSHDYVASRLQSSAGPVNIPSATTGTARLSAPSNDNGSSSRNVSSSGNGSSASASRPSSSGGPQAASVGSTSYSVASTSIPTSTASTSLSNSNGNDDDADETSIPETPFSSGHSPSHARHRFPHHEGGASPSAQSAGLASGMSDTDSPQQHPKELDDLDQSSTAAGVSNRASASSLSSNNNGKSDATTPQTSLPRLDIPTTHTILANPLPQSASGLTSALSAVLPSALSSNSATGGFPASGRAGNSSSNAIGPGGAATGFDIDDMIGRLLEAGYSSKLTKSVCLKNNEITAICSAAREVFLSQPTLIELSPPVKIVGDVHGQYWDLIRLFEMCGFPPKANYLFLGDYVDRGKQSLETILLLLCYKVKYPENFFLLRGNHECANVTRVYGFYDECKRRCNIKVWKTFVDVFNCLPITALVAGKIFCVHGGLSPSLSTMDDIRRIARPTDVPDYGLLNDLLWSDPSDTALDWEDNERGVSYCFGKAVIQDFLAKYDFDLICRAHMVVEDGYEFWNERTLVTIFSAPNYCGEFDNFAATMSVSEDLLCAFELLKPLDGAALKKELLKCKRKNSAAVAAGKPSNSGF